MAAPMPRAEPVTMAALPARGRSGMGGSRGERKGIVRGVRPSLIVPRTTSVQHPALPIAPCPGGSRRLGGASPSRISGHEAGVPANRRRSRTDPGCLGPDSTTFCDTHLTLAMRPTLPLALLIAFAAVARADDVKPTADPLVAPILKDKPWVGLVVGVWTGGKPHVFGYGAVTTPAGRAPPDGDTLFEIGSITKAFTGVLLADAVGRKEVALDDDANVRLPADLRIKTKPGKPVTLLHLVAHRSGLPVQPPLIGLTAKNPANPYADFTRPRLARLLRDLTPPGEPGREYAYSNLAAGLLGHALVAAAEAESYDALVKARVARPLGLVDTAEAPTGAQRARLARGHAADGTPTDPWDFAALEACGALRSSANDMLRFAAANLAGAKSPLADALKTSREPRAAAGGGVEIGLGWHLLKLAGERVVWHNGGTGGFRSMLAVAPDSGRAVVVLCAADLGDAVDVVALKLLTKIPK